MRIAQIAPPWEQVPPITYGGIELVVSRLTDELVRRGHDVTLFASGDSQTIAKLEASAPKALRFDREICEPMMYELAQTGQVYQLAERFDIIHSHVGVWSLPLAAMVDTPTVHTLHGRFTRDNSKVFTQYQNQAFISISDAQRQLDLNYVGTVYNGTCVDEFPWIEKPQQPPYLAFLGRFSPEKGPQHAIKIAQQTGWNLKMAGKVDIVDKEFFDAEIAPYIDGEQIEFLGELNCPQKAELLGHASATLFPITWDEPFGLVMIESMAAGTPVIAMKRGSVPEVIAHGETGFICESYEEMVSFIPKALELDRKKCRDRVVHSFSVEKMVDGYEAIYEQILKYRNPGSWSLQSLRNSLESLMALKFER